jgi:hypothetical protein
MATLLRVKLKWSGLPGGIGYSLFHMRDFSTGEPTLADANGAIGKVDNFINTIKPLIPPVVSMVVESEVEVIEETNGQMQTVLGGTSLGTEFGMASGTAGYSAPVGAVISWSTGGVRNGRRVRGRTFVVPLSNEAWDTDGTLKSTALTTLNAAATSLRDIGGSPDLGVYARPTSAGATDGIWYAATGHRVPDMAAVLRSRRS